MRACRHTAPPQRDMHLPDPPLTSPPPQHHTCTVHGFTCISRRVAGLLDHLNLAMGMIHCPRGASASGHTTFYRSTRIEKRNEATETHDKEQGNSNVIDQEKEHRRQFLARH
jgi:hypothetical protein